MERRKLDGSFFKTALNKDEVKNILSEINNLKMTEKENGLFNKKTEIKCESLCPAPHNILCLGLQTPRTPAPRILQLLPSQSSDFFGEEYSSKNISKLGDWSITTFKDNVIPTGRQLPRTPDCTNQQGKLLLDVLKDYKVLNLRDLTAVVGPSHSVCDTLKLQIDADVLEELLREEPSVKTNASKAWVYTKKKDSLCPCMQQPDHNCSTSGIKENGKEVAPPLIEDEQDVQERVEPLQESPTPDCFTATSTNRKRISQIPVQGLSEMNISMMINRIKGYQCTKEDMEFLRHMKNQEQGQILKAKYLRLQKELTTVVQAKELLLAQREKVQGEIVQMVCQLCSIMLDQNLDMSGIHYLLLAGSSVTDSEVASSESVATEQGTKRGARDHYATGEVAFQKTSYARTVQLGRAFLGNRMDPAAVETLPAKDVLEQLNPVTLQHFQQREQAELQALKEELKKLKSSIAQLPQKQGTRLKRKSYKQWIQEAEQSVQQEQEDVKNLQCEVETAQSKLAAVQEQLCNTRAEIEKLHTLKERTPVSRSLENAEDFDTDYLNRRLNRILRRTDIFLEREKIIKKFSLLD